MTAGIPIPVFRHWTPEQFSEALARTKGGALKTIEVYAKALQDLFAERDELKRALDAHAADMRRLGLTSLPPFEPVSWPVQLDDADGGPVLRRLVLEPDGGTATHREMRATMLVGSNEVVVDLNRLAVERLVVAGLAILAGGAA